MNSRLEKLVNLTGEFGSKNLELLKQKDAYLMSTWTVLKDLAKKNCLIKNVFIAL